MDSAAISMSRTAIQFRPVLPRAMFIASSVRTVTTTTTTKNISMGEVKEWPKMTISCAVMMPEVS